MAHFYCYYHHVFTT